MTPATEDLTIGFQTKDAYKTLPQGDNPARYGPLQTEDRLTPLNDLLGQLMPNVPISTFVYKVNDIADLSQGAFGALIVSESSDLTPLMVHIRASSRNGPETTCRLTGLLGIGHV